jgi:nucleotide-binding universal stress UspA family protein
MCAERRIVMLARMSANVIVSYDGSDNDDDGLGLARQLKNAGLSLALAYVRHSHEFDSGREEIAQFDADKRLDLGATRLGDPDLPKHVLIAPSTGEGLRQFAESEGASIIVFGSEYRTTPGRAQPGKSAQHLLENGSLAIGVAAAGSRAHPDAKVSTIRVFSPADDDDAAQQTADSLAAKLGASVTTDAGPADLIVVGSSSGVAAGRIALGGSTRSMLDSAQGSVLVVPRATPVLV